MENNVKHPIPNKMANVNLCGFGSGHWAFWVLPPFSLKQSDFGAILKKGRKQQTSQVAEKAIIRKYLGKLDI